MVAASVGMVLGMASIVAWIMSGRSPFLLAAMGLLFLEAVRAELFASFLPAARIFARRVRRRFVVVRQEVSA
jgi:hypothetical protein